MLAIDNEDQILEDKKLYGITPKKASRIFWGAVLNSSLTRFFMDLECRQLTGAQAIADVDVRVVEDILIARPEIIDDQLLSKPYKAICSRLIDSHVSQEYGRSDRHELDDVFFDALQLTKDERKAVYEAVTSLVEERLKKAESV